MYRSWYRFADTVFRLECTMPIRTGGDLDSFQVESGPEQYLLQVDFAPQGMELPDDLGRARVSREGDLIRIFLDRTQYTVPSVQHIFDLITLPFLLLEQRTMILHAAYVLYRGEALLFSGPSGVGKSTQAALWERERDAQIINGDRTLIFQRDGRLFAGSHFQSGTSGVCKNVSAPIRALILLGQGTEDRIYIPRGSELFCRLASQMIGRPDRSPLVDTAVSLLAALASDVTVCCYDCTMDRHAVGYLERYLYDQ